MKQWGEKGKIETMEKRGKIEPMEEKKGKLKQWRKKGENRNNGEKRGKLIEKGENQKRKWEIDRNRETKKRKSGNCWKRGKPKR